MIAVPFLDDIPSRVAQCFRDGWVVGSLLLLAVAVQAAPSNALPDDLDEWSAKYGFALLLHDDRDLYLLPAAAAQLPRDKERGCNYFPISANTSAGTR